MLFRRGSIFFRKFRRISHVATARDDTIVISSATSILSIPGKPQSYSTHQGPCSPLPITEMSNCQFLQGHFVFTPPLRNSARMITSECFYLPKQVTFLIPFFFFRNWNFLNKVVLYCIVSIITVAFPSRNM